MKIAFALVALALASTPAAKAASDIQSTAQPTKCSKLPKNQQNLFKLFNAYRASGTWDDALLYFGALEQYNLDFNQFVNPNNPATSTMNGVALFESLPSQLCTSTTALENKAKNGDPDAILFFLAYSAASRGDDGAAAEVLEELQHVIKTKYPHIVRQALAHNHAFFDKHPMVWL